MDFSVFLSRERPLRIQMETVGDVWIAARLPLSYWCSGFGYSLNSVGHGSS